MRKKFDKYWGKLENLNDYMYFAVFLDPQMKSTFLKHAFKTLVKYTVSEEMRISESVLIQKQVICFVMLKRSSRIFFMRYKETFDVNGSSQEEKNDEVLPCEERNDILGDFLNVVDNNSVSTDTELKRYLSERNITYTKDFDILKWWQKNAERFPLVSRMTKDILAIQISTVASEFAFSTSGRVLDPYRTSLSPSIVEALVCTQDWVRKSRKQIIDDIDDILKYDDIALEIEEAIRDPDGKGKK